MATENGDAKQAMWRVSEQMTTRVDAFKAKLEAKLGIKMNRTQVLDYLLDKALQASGLEPAREGSDPEAR